MPDARLAKSLIATARRLVPVSAKHCSQGNIRTAISTSYYAMYHALARVAADSLVGAKKSQRPNNAWVEVYRGLSHSSCKQACQGAKNIGFPDEIQGFANNFVQLQDARKRADYDPLCRPSKEQALWWIAIADLNIKKLYSCSRYDKVAFATWVLITSPGANQARQIVKNGTVRGLAPQLADE